MSGFPAGKQTYLYAVERDGRGIKIGVSCQPRVRANQLGAKLLKVRIGDHRDEHELHGRLVSHHIRGEWYEDCTQVREAFSRWHAPEFLLDRAGAWMPQGSLPLALLAADEDQSLLERTSRRNPRRISDRPGWDAWEERARGKYAKPEHQEPVALDGRAA